MKQKRWRYKNFVFLAISILFAYIIFQSETIHDYLLWLGTFGYIGAFIAGILFVSTFTVATGMIILVVLAKTLSPIEIGLIAGLGAVTGDLIIFRFVKDDLSKEVKNIYNKFDKNHHLKKLFRTKYFAWTLPVIGAIIIASPLPDEVGVSLMEISKLKPYQFLVISFILNSIGIFLVVSASIIIIKP